MGAQLGRPFLCHPAQYYYIFNLMDKPADGHPMIAVVGHLVKDEIVALDGGIMVALGGIAYNLAALCTLMKAGRVYPVCRIGHDLEKLLYESFQSPIFDIAGIKFFNHPSIIHKLTYKSPTERQEWNSGKPSPLRLDKVPLSADAIMFNFISGSDVRPAELQQFRNRYCGLIFCDYHSLALGRSKENTRFHRHHRHWKAYLSIADMVQMNLAELSSIVQFELSDIRQVAEALTTVHDVGPGIVIITMGAEGVVLSDAKCGLIYHVPGVKIDTAVDPTGCGDTLGAAFVYYYLGNHDVVKSIELASHFAAAKATFSGLRGFKEIEVILNSIGAVPKAKII